MKWSLVVGRFWGTEIQLHASLLLLIPYVLLAFRPSNVGGAARMLLLIAAIFFCVTLHEVGHTLAARFYGIEVKSIVLWPLGGFANLSQRPTTVLPNLIITAAGPFVNLILTVGFLILAIGERLLLRSLALPNLSLWLSQLQIFPFLVGLLIANLSLAVFNLIPIYPLDGGQIARDLLKLIFGEKRADQLLLLISLPLALGVTVLGIVTLDIIILLTGLMLVLASISLNARMTNVMTLGTLFVLDRGGYYLKNGDYDQAVQAYSRAIQRRPNRAGLYANRAVAYLNLMAFDAVRADLEHALKIDLKHFLAWALLGELEELSGNYKQALESYNRAIELKPGWAISYADRGGLYHKTGHLTQSQADLDQAISLGQGIVVAYVLRSILRYEMGDLPGSQADQEQALKYAPEWMLAFPEVFIDNFKGHLNWVLDYYQRAIQQMPNTYQAYQGRADALLVNGRADWAVEDYHRAIAMAPQQAELYLGRGQAYQQLGLHTYAAADFQRAEQVTNKSHVKRQAQSLLRTLPQPAA